MSNAPTFNVSPQVARDYPHRMPHYEQYGMCPVCCGDKVTTDRRYGAAKVDSTAVPSQLYTCNVCEPTESEERKRTITQARKDLRSHGITLRRVEGEFQVYPKGGGEIYYTDDLQDAYGTGMAMAGDFRFMP